MTQLTDAQVIAAKDLLMEAYHAGGERACLHGFHEDDCEALAFLARLEAILCRPTPQGRP